MVRNAQSDEYFFNHVKYGQDIYSNCYDKYMLIGDFNAEESRTVSFAISFRNERKKILLRNLPVLRI